MGSGISIFRAGIFTQRNRALSTAASLDHLVGAQKERFRDRQPERLGGRMPVGLGVVGIAVVLPGGDFVDEGLFVGDEFDCCAFLLSDGSAATSATKSALLRHGPAPE